MSLFLKASANLSGPPESKRHAKTYRVAERTDESVESIVELGKKSTAFVRSSVPIGTEVSLELDVQAMDMYGRTLAYVYLPDGTMLNELINRQEINPPH